MTELAGYLPGLAPETVARKLLRVGALDVAVPVLAEEQSVALAGRLREAGVALRAMPAGAIAAAIDRAVARLLDPAEPLRRKADALLPAATGYDAEIVRLGLLRLLRAFRLPELKRFLAGDLGNPALLDGFQPLMKGGYGRAHGPRLLLHVWAGNVPALPLWSLCCGLLVKAPSAGKVASAEPLFAGWFAELLAEVEPRLADALAVLWWQGGDTQAERPWLGVADTVFAYGGEAALADLSRRLPPGTRFLAHGHKLSFGLIAREALTADRAAGVAALAAEDIVRFDQQGCYSPQMLFVERGGAVSPADFVRHLGGALAAAERRHPRRALSPLEAGAVAAWRAEAEMALDGAGAEMVIGDQQGRWTLSYREDVDRILPSALDRSITVAAIDDLSRVASLLAPHRRLLQSVALAAPPARLHGLAEGLAEAGVTRIAALGALAAPEAGWHHDGRFSLLDLVTISEIDAAAVAEAERFDSHAD